MQKMMPESYGLGALQMSVPGANRVFIFFRFIRDNFYQRRDFFGYVFRLFAQIHTEIECDLVVTATRGMKFFTDSPYARGQRFFHKGI